MGQGDREASEKESDGGMFGGGGEDGRRGRGGWELMGEGMADRDGLGDLAVARCRRRRRHAHRRLRRLNRSHSDVHHLLAQRHLE